MDTVTTKVKTGKVRFSYVHVFEPTAINESSEKKYNISILIDKTDEKTLERISKGVDAAIELGKDKLSKNGKLVANLKMPLRDGDEERPDDPAYEGKFFVNASTTRRPGIVDKDLNDIVDKDEFYSGCYGRATLNFYAFNAEGNRGVACGLQNLQKLEDGENLTGSTNAATDFEDDDDLN